MIEKSAVGLRVGSNHLLVLAVGFSEEDAVLLSMSVVGMPVNGENSTSRSTVSPTGLGLLHVAVVSSGRKTAFVVHRRAVPSGMPSLQPVGVGLVYAPPVGAADRASLVRLKAVAWIGG